MCSYYREYYILRLYFFCFKSSQSAYFETCTGGFIYFELFCLLKDTFCLELFLFGEISLQNRLPFTFDLACAIVDWQAAVQSDATTEQRLRSENQPESERKVL